MSNLQGFEVLKAHWKKIVPVLAFISLVGGYLGNFNNIASAVDRFNIADPDEAIYGIWLSKYQYPVQNGVVEMVGTTEYFKNNSYNYVGEMSFKVKTGDYAFDALYLVDGTGAWQADSGLLITQLKDMRSSPKSIILDGVPVDTHLSTMVLGRDFPGLEESLPKGLNEEYKIISMSKDQLVLAVDDPLGNVFEFTMKRQNRRFQR